MTAVVSRTTLPTMPFEDINVSEDLDVFTDPVQSESELLWVPESEEPETENSDFEGTSSAESNQEQQLQTTTESLINDTTTPQPTTTTTTITTQAQPQLHSTEITFDQRPPSPSSSEPPSMVLSFHSNLFHVFSLPSSDESTPQSDNNSGVLFSDKPFLYKSPLQSFMSELQTHFSIENDITLDFPDLKLSFSTHMIYAQKVTLAHVHLLMQALQNDQPLPLRASLIILPNAFLKQYNELIVLAQSRKDAYIHPLSPSASSSELPVPKSVTQPTGVSSVPFESSEEIESEEFTANVVDDTRTIEVAERTETIETTAPIIDNTDEIFVGEEETKFSDEPREGDQLDLGEEEEPVELEEDSAPAGEELDVEIDDINSDLVLPADNEPIFSPSSTKPHARHYEEEEGEDGLARKRPRFAPQDGSGDTTEEASDQL